jgi:Putative transposase
MYSLLSWVHPGFSVFAGEILSAEDRQELEQVARYIARPAIGMDKIRRHKDGHLEIKTPPDPRTGASIVRMDPLDFIHAVTAHIPDRGRHQVRYYGALSNRTRSGARLRKAETCQGTDAPQASDEGGEFKKAQRASWARLLRKIFEVDPLLCSCGAEMRLVSFITEPRVVDRILRHEESAASKARDPFEPRAPPAAMPSFLGIDCISD